MQNRDVTSLTTVVTIDNNQYEILSRDVEEIFRKSDNLNKVNKAVEKKIALGEHFGNPNLDGSFKYIYTREACKYGIRFARDLEIISDTKPLDKRDCCVLRKECEECNVEELESKVTSSTENDKRGAIKGN